MKRFIQGEHRTQITLLPEILDDYVTAENPVRVIDVFVDNLDLKKLGFEGVTPAVTGRPSYHTRFQNHCQLPQRQWSRHYQCLPPVRGDLQTTQSVCRVTGDDRRQ
jgi:hypothetical protein